MNETRHIGIPATALNDKGQPVKGHIVIMGGYASIFTDWNVYEPVIKSSVKLDPSALSTEILINLLKQKMSEMPCDGERIDVINNLFENYCKLCGTKHLPCFCSPHFDA